MIKIKQKTISKLLIYMEPFANTRSFLNLLASMYRFLKQKQIKICYKWSALIMDNILFHERSSNLNAAKFLLDKGSRKFFVC